MTHPAETFRALHVKGNPFVMVNIWDCGSAKMMQAMGAKALATSSAAHAFTMGRPDGGTLSRDEALAHAADILSVATVPVQGDFENGFGHDPDTCAETVRLAAEVGLAGICIEDTKLPTDNAYEFELAVERIKAACAAARALPVDFVLTARADGILTGAYDTDEAIRRLQAFEQAGADCLYAPLPPDMDAMARIVAATNAPVNTLVSGSFTAQSLADYGKIGVARISLGSALARVTHRVMHDAMTAMVSGDFSPLSQGISSDIIDALLE
ncbi:isocitrate lyase/PEP mutase family protein [Yoonia sediminilitoris]|uniref:2-methylisocitrate lyase-like PEP mutase family enzyme n=1 Tax=Yoonia sediminilitoris TaxID=1286148 RepID=A0A2T6KRY3_9RHOB|nr:isocitrate lyase/phosphoenolpyruvate mutase family protein [Yoonia sediminilitoris]PUB19323.1 2-methylisocitrate lyase-like PEP mutase family enzyme [Yoonia sediminilitoris]RCW99491.1 2-methylisocitrate lyase-like PEP mutase family enzyme [Yoonia sediminilitoris]